VLTFVKELGEFYGSNRPQLFGFIDSLEATDINSPGLEFLDGSHFWEGSPRYAQADDSEAQKAYRAAVGIDDNGAAVGDPKDVSTAAHMFGCWETLYVVKKAMEDSGYKGPEDRAKLVEATEALTEFAEGPEHPQGPKDLQRQDPPVSSASRTSPRSKAASSRWCTRPRSRTGCTSLKGITRRRRFSSLLDAWLSAKSPPSVLPASPPQGGDRQFIRQRPSAQRWRWRDPLTTSNLPLCGGDVRQDRGGWDLAHPLVLSPCTSDPHLLLATLEGLVTSAVLALTALGLSLVFGVMRVVNVAHGEFFMLGAVLAWAITTTLSGHPRSASSPHW
jgi:hypothetical protein